MRRLEASLCLSLCALGPSFEAAAEDPDWDQAASSAIPVVRSASSAEAYERAVQTMLDLLHDPLTRVEDPLCDDPDPGGAAASAPRARP